MLFREHRGLLADSMETVTEVADLDALLAHIRKIFQPYGPTFLDAEIRIEPYGRDNRINWDTYIVILPEYGPIGFTDGPL